MKMAKSGKNVVGSGAEMVKSGVKMAGFGRMIRLTSPSPDTADIW